MTQAQSRYFTQNWFRCLLRQTFSPTFVTYCGGRLIGVSVVQRLSICDTNQCLNKVCAFLPMSFLF